MSTVVVNARDLGIRSGARSLLETLADEAQLVFVSEGPVNGKLAAMFAEKAIDVTRLPTRTRRDRLAHLLQRWIGALPCPHEYRVLQRYRRAAVKCRLARTKLWAMAQVRTRLWFSLPVRTFLRLLSSPVADLPRADAYVFFTHFESYSLLRVALRSTAAVGIVIESWDHICKETMYPDDQRITYFVAGAKMADDLRSIHGIEKATIEVLGSLQLSEALQYNDATQGIEQQPFVYYVCAHGYPATVLEEIRLIDEVRQIVSETLPDHYLLVRPYPIGLSPATYAELTSRAGVELETVSSDQFILAAEKYAHIRRASCVIHSGTTLGLESAVCDVPTIFVAPRDWTSASRDEYSQIRSGQHIQHFERYLNHGKLNHVVHTRDEFRSAVERVRDRNLKPTSIEVLQDFSTGTFGQMAGEIASALGLRGEAR